VRKVETRHTKFPQGSTITEVLCERGGFFKRALYWWRSGRLAGSRREGGKSGMITGQAKDDKELFEFTIKPFVTTGFLLSIRYSGDCHHNVTGAGVWPTIDKAKQIAQETATRLLQGAIVSWNEDSK
jgi:hypothetical protein